MSIGKPFCPFIQRLSERFLTRNIIPINEKYNTKKDELNEKFNTFNEKYSLFSLTICTFAAELKSIFNLKQKDYGIYSQLRAACSGNRTD